MWGGGVVVAYEILVSAQGPLVLGFWVLGLRVWGQGLTIALSRVRVDMDMATKNQKHDMSDMASFKRILASLKHVVILTAAGVSAVAFRGAGSFWRTLFGCLMGTREQKTYLLCDF